MVTFNRTLVPHLEGWWRVAVGTSVPRRRTSRSRTSNDSAPTRSTRCGGRALVRLPVSCGHVARRRRTSSSVPPRVPRRVRAAVRRGVGRRGPGLPPGVVETCCATTCAGATARCSSSPTCAGPVRTGVVGRREAHVRGRLQRTVDRPQRLLPSPRRPRPDHRRLRRPPRARDAILPTLPDLPRADAVPTIRRWVNARTGHSVWRSGERSWRCCGRSRTSHPGTWSPGQHPRRGTAGGRRHQEGRLRRGPPSAVRIRRAAAHVPPDQARREGLHDPQLQGARGAGRRHDDPPQRHRSPSGLRRHDAREGDRSNRPAFITVVNGLACSTRSASASNAPPDAPAPPRRSRHLTRASRIGRCVRVGPGGHSTATGAHRAASKEMFDRVSDAWTRGTDHGIPRSPRRQGRRTIRARWSSPSR